MPASNPSPPPFASATLAGLVSLAAQSFAGVKTFVSTLIASAGIQVASLFNTNGAGAADVVVTVGTNVADASVSATAKLLSVRTGVGGSEVEKAYFDATGALVVSGNANSRISVSGGTLLLAANTLPVAGIAFYSAAGQTTGFYAQGSGNTSGAHSAAGRWRAWSETLGGTSTDTVMVFGTLIADASIHPDSQLMTCRSGLLGTEVNKWAVRGSGRMDQLGTDSSGSPGAATINKPIGKSAIAAGAASVVITNSLVVAASHIVITPHARDATCKELIAVPTAGSFTVSGSANATAALPFSWEVKGLL